MKLLVLGDLHYALRQYDWLAEAAPDYDVLCITGDLLDTDTDVPKTAQIIVVRNYLEEIAKRTRVILCSGEHDLTTKDTHGECFAHWLPALADFGVITDGGTLSVGRTLISSLPWWDGRKARRQIRDQLQTDARADRDVWIWLHHAPPADSLTAWSGERSFGDTYLGGLIDEFRPEAVFSGHVHAAPFFSDAGWTDKVEDTLIFNAGRKTNGTPSHIVYDDAAQIVTWYSPQRTMSFELEMAQPPVPETFQRFKAWDRLA